MNVYNKAFWTQIGLEDPTGRRSMWARVNYLENSERPESIELRAGREGSDSYFRITPENPLFQSLYGVVQDQLYAVQLRESL